MTKCVLNVIAWVFIFAGVVEAVWGLLEKPQLFDPRGQVLLTPCGKI